MKWPSELEPGNSPVYARNEITIAAPADRVWRWLIRAARWPDWYSNSRHLEFLNTEPPDLAAGTEFQWGTTFGATIRSKVIVFEPPHELGWDARGILRAYHGWLIEPGPDGCRVITEECQNGILPKLAWWYLRPMLLRGHQNWVESLRRVAQGGEPA